MAKSAYEYIKESLRQNLSKMLIEWRRQPVIFKLEKPTDIGRARVLGYKDKKGFSVFRVRVIRGGHRRSRPSKGRKVKNLSVRKNLKMSYQWIAEQRAARKYPNLEVLNSYRIGKDGMHYFFEVIMIDPSKPEINNDSNFKWVRRHENLSRVYRGLTSAGRKSRGLMNRSRQLKIRPSQRAHDRQGK